MACLLAVSLVCACAGDERVEPLTDDPGSGSDVNAPIADSGTSQDLGSPGQDVAQPEQDMDEPGAATWTDLAPVGLGPRQESAVVALDGLVWVLGGFNESAQIVAFVEAYDPKTDAWSRRADFPIPAHHMNAAVHDGRIFVTGFLTTGFRADGRSFVYDPAEDSWSPTTDLPADRARGASASGVINGKIYVAGGIAGGAVPWFDVFDPVTGTWSALPDVPRDVDHAAFGVITDTLIVATGRDGSINALDSAVHRFDPSVGAWTDGAPIPTPRGGVASAVTNGKLYVFGGEGNQADPSGVFDQVEAYELATDRWESLGEMPAPRHGLGAAVVDGVIYLPGGAPTEALDATAVHQSFRP